MIYIADEVIMRVNNNINDISIDIYGCFVSRWRFGAPKIVTSFKRKDLSSRRRTFLLHEGREDPLKRPY